MLYENDNYVELNANELKKIRVESKRACLDDLKTRLDNNNILTGKERINNMLDCIELGVTLVNFYDTKPSFKKCVETKIKQLLKQNTDPEIEQELYEYLKQLYYTQ